MMRCITWIVLNIVFGADSSILCNFHSNHVLRRKSQQDQHDMVMMRYSNWILLITLFVLIIKSYVTYSHSYHVLRRKSQQDQHNLVEMRCSNWILFNIVYNNKTLGRGDDWIEMERDLIRQRPLAVIDLLLIAPYVMWPWPRLARPTIITHGHKEQYTHNHRSTNRFVVCVCVRVYHTAS